MKRVKQLLIFPQTQFSFKLSKEQFDSLSVDRLARTGMRISFLSIGLSLIILAVCANSLPPEVPMLYSRPYGQNQLLPAWGLIFLPGLALLINLVCLRLASAVMVEEKLLTQILIWSGTLAALMAVINLIKIIFLVI
jgi:hypothetical protein